MTTTKDPDEWHQVVALIQFAAVVVTVAILVVGLLAWVILRFIDG